MLKKILVANRGEIACRIFATAKRLGIATVAVYSDADRDSLHVSMADEAIPIGPAVASESYLNIEKIVRACKETGADSVHPGYGFLSENAQFRDALDEANIIFIGPEKLAIESMGDKITSKLIAEKAGVSVIPGFTDVVKDADHAANISKDIGYPVMIKASAGGGGKGMRVARNEEECREGFKRARNEASSSFGDDRIFIEKFIEEPRHIEIQIIADGSGNTIYLGERECSIQRRHQKVIEEAPSPFLDEETRRAMGEQSCALARAVNYRSAGTVEFIVDIDRNFYFLEMNTRLQVEHPVTELVSGLDIVEMMFVVASGGELSIRQEDISLNGWAIESRVYAEDPLRDFLPSTGRLTNYLEPTGEGVRVDSGVYEGGEVSIYYDPMIAKLVTFGENRDQAIASMSKALDNYYIRGVNHNISFLNSLMNHPRFLAGNLTTNFISEEYPDGFSVDPMSPDDLMMMIAVVVLANHFRLEREAKLSGQLSEHQYRPPHDWVVVAGGESTPASIKALEEGGHVIKVSGVDHHITTDWKLGDPIFNAKIQDRFICVQMETNVNKYVLYYRGAKISAEVLSKRASELSVHMLHKEPEDLSKFLLSPMPGLLVSISVSEGDSVKVGDELAVVEAMKMENSLRAVQNGVVSAVRSAVGDSLAVDQVILEFE
ncbi:MAG: acetyl/propionyl-CoA carboxylase subunit alpha [Porticoccaceae bacterium]|nr:acetyl/propionyl-CoA carboxylase subunit alpha [Porticoccaceae bacterium]